MKMAGEIGVIVMSSPNPNTWRKIWRSKYQSIFFLTISADQIHKYYDSSQTVLEEQQF